MIEADVLILGGGVAGLAAATALGDRAIVLERGPRPGGLVRSERIGGWWFDRVLHLLYFPDDATASRTRAMLPGVLAPCPPEAWVHARSGVTRYPFQAHLGTLPQAAIDGCLADLALCQSRDEPPAQNYREMLERTFGRAMCREFFFPYNRKMWRRPLDQLAPGGFHWNIARPSWDEVMRGARERDHRYRAYNAHGFYPRPPSGIRGMEVLSRGLAACVHDLRVGHEVVGIDVATRRVTVRHRGRIREFRYRDRLVSTLPLPALAAMIGDWSFAPRASLTRLPVNQVLSVCLCIRGPRPHGSGHWRYFADPRLVFTRLVFMHEFDPDGAPDDGWGLMAEVPWRGDVPPPSDTSLLARTVADVARTKLVPPGCRIEAAHVLAHPFAYVVFRRQAAPLVRRAIDALRAVDIEPLGRYGRWEYSSMGQVIRDGFAVGDALGAGVTTVASAAAD